MLSYLPKKYPCSLFRDKKMIYYFSSRLKYN